MADVVTRAEDLDALLERRELDSYLWMWENAAAFDQEVAADWPATDPAPEPLDITAAAPIDVAAAPVAAPAPTLAPEQAHFRFLPAGKAEIEAKAASLLTNRHTARATEASAALFDDWRLGRKAALQTELPPMAELPKAAFLDAIQLFIHEVRKSDGERYAPTSMKTMVNSLMRAYSSATKIAFNVWKDPDCKEVVTALSAYAAELQLAGHRSSHADALSPEEWRKVLALPEVDMKTPSGLLRRLYVLLALTTGVRIQEHHHMKRAWFDLKNRFDLTDKNGMQRTCIRLPIAADKTHQTGLARVGNEDANVVHIFSAPAGTPPENDVLHVIDEYLSHCPPVKTPNDPLYLRPLTKITAAPLWFTANPCGYNFLGEILKKLSDKVPTLQNRKITSHSARASFVTALYGDLNLSEELIMEMSKHVSTDGARKYKRANPTRALVASDVITTTLRTERTERTVTTVAVSAAPSSSLAAAPVKQSRGPYSCTQCRQPKRNHVCALTPPADGAVPVRPAPAPVCPAPAPVRPAPAPVRPAPAPVAVRKRDPPPVTTRAGRVVRRKCED